jgi:hypothetical protein
MWEGQIDFFVLEWETTWKNCLFSSPMGGWLSSSMYVCATNRFFVPEWETTRKNCLFFLPWVRDNGLFIILG